MDNSRYYTSLSTYDYSLFTTKESTARKLPSDNPVIKMPEKKTALQNSVSGVFSIILVAAFILSMICAEMYLRAEITEVHSKTHTIQKEINELESRETALEIQLEQRISYTNLEQKAMELGMMKPRRDQIVYIKTVE